MVFDWIYKLGFKGLLNRSINRVTRKHIRLAKHIRKGIIQTENLKTIVTEAIKARNSENFEESFIKEYDAYKEEAKEIVIIEKGVQGMTFDLIQKLKEMISLVKDDIKKRTDNVEDINIKKIINNVNQHEHELQTILDDRKEKILNVARGLHKMLGLRSIKDFEGLTNQIIKNEKRVRSRIKQVDKELKKIRNIFSKNNKPQELHKLDIQTLNIINDFLDGEVYEAKRLRDISENGLIILTHITKDITDMDNLLSQVKETGLSIEWCDKNHLEISRISNEIKGFEHELFTKEENLDNQGHSQELKPEFSH